VTGSSEKKSATMAAAYSAAVDAAQLGQIRLVKSEFRIEPESLDGGRGGTKNSFGFQFTSSAYDAEKSIATAFFSGSVEIKSGRKRVLSLKCAYVVAYHIFGEPSEEAVKQFVERVGKFAAYPYFRSHFADVASQAGLIMPPLPVLKDARRPIPATEPDLVSELEGE
jgi:hypothetical protein